MRTVTDPGEPASFEDYAGTAWPALYRYAYLLAGNHADAEDLAQQALIKAYGAWTRVAAADAPMAYLRRTLTNTYLSQRRPKARRMELLTDAPPDGLSPPASGPEDRLALWPLVTALPPRQRAVVVLRYYEDLSEQQIADVLGCSRGNVKSTAHRALTSLKAALSAATADAAGGRES